VSGRFVSSHEWLTRCPDCDKEKLYYNVSKEIGWCHYCSKVFTKINTDGENLSWSATPGKDSELAVFNDEARRFLESRGVTELDMVTLPIKWDGEQLIFPIHSPAPEFPPRKMRRLLDWGKWLVEKGIDRKFYCFGIDVLRPAKDVILVEGIFDVLTPGFHGYAIAILGTQLHDTLLVWLEMNREKVYLWLDPDEAGMKATRVIRKRLELAGVDVEEIKAGREPGDCNRDDALVQEVRQRIRLR
jgi:hypothetical protein